MLFVHIGAFGFILLFVQVGASRFMFLLLSVVKVSGKPDIRRCLVHAQLAQYRYRCFCIALLPKLFNAMNVLEFSVQ